MIQIKREQSVPLSRVPLDADMVPDPKPASPVVKNGRRPTGREVADQAINLRVYLAVQLRSKCESAGLDPDQWSSSAVTALTISLERQGVRGIQDETFETLS